MKNSQKEWKKFGYPFKFVQKPFKHISLSLSLSVSLCLSLSLYLSVSLFLHLCLSSQVVNLKKSWEISNHP